MKKKLLSLFLVVGVMLLTLTGCGTKPTEKTAAAVMPTEIKENVEITFWHSMSGVNQEAMQKITTDFEAKNPKIKVKLVNQGGYTVLFDKLMAAAKSNTLPTITQIYNNRLTWYMSKDLVEDLYPYFNNKMVGMTDSQISDIPKMYRDDNTWGDKVYAIPFNKSMMVLYYNEDMLKARGVDVPKTWAEFQEAAKKLTVDSNNDGTPEVYGVAFENNISTDIGIWVRQAGGEVIDEKTDKINFNTPQTKEAVDLINNMIQAKTAILAGEDKSSNVTFVKQKAAMCVASTSGIPTIKSGLKAKWFAAALPTYKENVQLYYGTNVAMFKSGSVEQKLAAWLYLKYLVDTENTAYFSIKTGYMPVRNSAIKSDEYVKFLQENPVKEVPLKSLDKGWIGARQIGVIPALDTLGAELDQVFNKKKTVDQALKDAQEKGEKAMKEARNN